MWKYPITTRKNKITKSLLQGFNLKDKAKIIILEILCLILLIITIYLCFRNFSLSNQLSKYQPKLNNTVIKYVANTDSKYMGKKTQSTSVYTTPNKFREIPAYKGNLNPKNILYWNSGDLKKSKLSSSSNTNKWLTSCNDRDSNISKSSFSDTKLLENLYNFEKDSLVQILLNRKELKLSSFNSTTSKFRTVSYEIDLNRYSYNWTPSQGLTFKRVYPVQIYPYIRGGYTIFNKEINFGTGINISTYNLDFSLEGCLNNSRGTSKNINTDIRVNLVYKFKSWLR
nr:MAG TPA: hypothetical protein [Caudoviricetes sp.]